jgi:hypothetical protein
MTYPTRQSFRFVNAVDAKASNLIPDSIDDQAYSDGAEYRKKQMGQADLLFRRLLDTKCFYRRKLVCQDLNFGNFSR